jgi:hypothetical protein
MITDWNMVLNPGQDDDPVWHWSIQGVEASQSPGVMRKDYSDEGVIKAEHAGQALDWLIHKGPIWDCLDVDEEFTITIRPHQPETAP